MLLVSGCARLGLPFGPGLDARQAPVDQTITNSTVTASVDPSDWETVRRTLAATSEDQPTGRLAWQNPQTGSSGAVEAEASEQRQGGVCRAFATIVNDHRGVRRYRGEACRRDAGVWQLTGIVADDRTLL
ncbi:RT0821/Lpp0805 family surface protein [Bauldia sp.]|uniref:RT0821/Lpp0805 family surface protein n=1 Tax=Bauldia sp. TaxID=2575872 RepID=UPI003BAACF25